jgi:hypothetical protein
MEPNVGLVNNFVKAGKNCKLTADRGFIEQARLGRVFRIISGFALAEQRLLVKFQILS